MFARFIAARQLVFLAFCAGILGLCAPPADAELIVDLKVIGVSGSATVDPGSDGTRVFVTGPDAVITVGIFANIRGADGNFANEGLVSLAGGILSSAPAGEPRGVIGTIGSVARSAMYTALGSQDGAANDLDGGLGDLDWGGPVQTQVAGWFIVRANTAPYPIMNSATSSAQLIGTFVYSVSSVNPGGTPTTLSWLRRNHPTATSNASWVEDWDGASPTISSPPNHPSYRAGTSVVLLAGGAGPTPANFVMTQASVTLPAVLINAAATATIQARNSGGQSGNFNTARDGHVSSVVPATGGPIGPGELVNLLVSMDTSDYGLRTGTVTITPNTGGGNVTTVSVNVGRATPATSGTNLKAFDPANKLSAAVPAGGSYAGLSSKTTAGGNVVGTEAIIRAGTNRGTQTKTVEMNWRDRADQEKFPGQVPPMPGPMSTLVSDVLNLTGMAASPTDPFVLQMSYSEALLPKPEAELAAGGNIYLAWLDETGEQSQWRWRRAVEGNTGQGANAVQNYQGSWDQFSAAYGTNLDVLLGSWGVDTASNNVWAVVNHNSQFAVVPEPATWLLLCMAIPGAVLVRRRRK